MTSQPIVPSPNRARPPAFEDLAYDLFEEFVCALVDKQPEIESADLFRTKFKSQCGLDILAQRRDGEYDAISCKVRQRLKPTDIPGWSEDFRKHLDGRELKAGDQTFRIKRFVLAVTQDTNSKERHEQIESQRKKFHEQDVEYDVWNKRRMQELVRPHWGIASQYLGEDIAKRICDTGSQLAQSTAAATVELPDLRIELDEALRALEVQTIATIESLVDQLRAGRLREVETALAALASGPNWKAATAEIRARIVRLQASLALARGDLDRAEVLARQADNLRPQEEARVNAVIALRRFGPARALEVLGPPTTDDGRLLELTIRLEDGATDDVLDRLQNDLRLPRDHAEFWRVMAIALLLKGERKEALSAIQKGSSAAPHWRAMKRACAITMYANGLSPIVRNEWLTYPNPIDPMLVCQHDEAQRLMADAEQMFAQLAGTAADEQERNLFRLWEFACACNQDSHRERAEQLCKQLCEGPNPDGTAILWAMGRDLTFDEDQTIESLTSAIRSTRANVTHVLALSMLTYWRQDDTAALGVLQPQRSLFEREGALDVYTAWIERFQTPDKNRPRASVDLRVVGEATKSGDWSAVEDAFRRAITQAPPDSHALALADVLAAHNRWEIVANHSEELLRFCTPTAASVVIFSLYKVREFQAAVDALHKSRSWFPDEDLPLPLKRLQVRALLGARRIPDAILMAQALSSQSSESIDHLQHIEVQLLTGDVDSASAKVRLLLDDGGATKLLPAEALRLAKFFEQQSPDVARRLVEHAAHQAIPNDWKMLAYQQARRLGQDDLAKAMAKDLQRLAQSGTGEVTAVTAHDYLIHKRARQEQFSKELSAYALGRFCWHRVARHGDKDVFTAYSLAHSTADAIPLGICHGSRRKQDGLLFPFPSDGSLRMDITALLVASQLPGLLDVVEGLVRTIEISQTLPTALVELGNNVARESPEYINARQVLACLDDGAIVLQPCETTPCEGSRSQASMQDGPNTESLRTKRASPSQLMGALTSMGRVSQQELLRWASEQEVELNLEPSVFGLSESDVVLVAGPSLEIATLAPFIRVASQHFKLQLSARTARELRDCLHSHEVSQEFARVIGELRQRIAAKLQGGKYCVVPASIEMGGEMSPHVEGERNDQASSQIEQGLRDVLFASASRRVVSWIDERFLSSFTKSEAGPLVTTGEVLVALKEAKSVSAQQYYSWRLKLQSRGAIFLPSDADEVIHQLTQCSVNGSMVVETDAVRAIRVSVNRAICAALESAYCDAPTDTKPQTSELWFAIEHRGLAERIIVALWADDELSGDRAKALSMWAWRSLRVEHLIAPRTHVGNDGSVWTILATALAALLLQLLPIVGGTSFSKSGRRAAYQSWLFDEIVAPRLTYTPALTGVVAREISANLLAIDQLVEQHLDADLRGAARAKTAVFISELPEQIRDVLLDDKVICTKFQVRWFRSLTLKGYDVPVDTFWHKAHNALRYGKASIRLTQTSGKLELRRISGVDDAILIKTPRGEVNMRDALVQLVQDRRNVQAIGATRIMDLADFDGHERLSAGNSLAKASLLERMNLASGWRHQTAANHYELLQWKLRNRYRVPPDELRPPTPQAILKHLRLTGGTDETFGKRWSAAATSLRADMGPENALRKLMRLPIPVDLTGCNDKPIDLFGRHLPETPIALMHALRALWKGGIVAAPLRSAEQHVRLLAGAWQRWGKCLVQLLQWTAEVSWCNASWRRHSTSDRLLLTWFHAVTLLDLLADAHVEPAKLSSFFTNQSVPTVFDRFVVTDTSFQSDVACPLDLTPQFLTASTLDYVFGTEGAVALISGMTLAERLQTVDLQSDEDVARASAIWGEREGRPNSLGSALSRPVLQVYLSFAAVGPGERQVVTELLAAVNANPRAASAWLFLRQSLFTVLVFAERTSVVGALKQVSTDVLLDIVRVQTYGIRAAQAICVIATAIGDRVVSTNLDESIIGVAEYLSRTPHTSSGALPFPSSGDTAALDVVLELMAWSSAAPSATDATERYCELLYRLIEEWPSCTPMLRDRIERYMMLATPESSRTLHSLWLVLRSMRQ